MIERLCLPLSTFGTAILGSLLGRFGRLKIGLLRLAGNADFRLESFSS